MSIQTILYWQVGEYISLKIKQAEWGESVVTELAKFLAEKHPDLKGFNARGLCYTLNDALPSSKS